MIHFSAYKPVSPVQAAPPRFAGSRNSGLDYLIQSQQLRVKGEILKTLGMSESESWGKGVRAIEFVNFDLTPPASKGSRWAFLSYRGGRAAVVVVADEKADEYAAKLPERVLNTGVVVLKESQVSNG